MNKRDTIVIELQGVLNDHTNRLEHINSFQRLVWEHDNLGLSPLGEDLVRDLAFDLDFYRQGNLQRDSTFYGDDILENEVKSVLRCIEEKG